MKKVYVVVSWVVTLMMPVVLILLGVRLLLTPVLLPIEYNMPGFPADNYGFTLDDRLEWSKFAVNYLINNADTSYLADLRFDDGSAVFNDREVSHMFDVKVVVQGALRGLVFFLVAIVVFTVWAWRAGWMDVLRSGISRGGWLALWMVVIPVLFLGGVFLFSGPQGFAYIFWDFFSGFHAIFFEGDTWLFKYSDTLIRLFPIRFWQDMFIYVFGFTALGGGLLGWTVKPRRV